MSKEAEIRDGKLKMPNQEVIEVKIKDDGEGYDPNKKGTVPNHEKIEIYINPKK